MVFSVMRKCIIQEWFWFGCGNLFVIYLFLTKPKFNNEKVIYTLLTRVNKKPGKVKEFEKKIQMTGKVRKSFFEFNF